MAKKRASIRILIADDHTVFRYGLRTLLECDPDFTVVGEAVDGTEVTQLITGLRPEILILDIAMPGLNGIEVLREITFKHGQVRTIILTAAIEKRQIVEALQLGARGILLKDAAIPMVGQCIQRVVAGGYWVGHEAVTSLVDYLREFKHVTEDQPLHKMPEFTPREREIVSAIVTGCSNKEIAAKLFISEDTVKHHLSNVFSKAGVSNRLELAIWSMNKSFL
jgi:Response regulator containing a CheY-like receiver domain and an HTH DNA-binding domain